MAENARAKGDRILIEGRIVVTAITPQRVDATTRGEGVIHHQTWTPAGGWHCTCPVVTDRCSHLHALRRVVAVDVREPT